ncbi:MAG: hypothetical protein CSA35_06810 [Dethiosulfovibrio peptidovorans]|nr:MAG: hypothetical protein CSA35_06810 [Dethiosulfovibrio peptidovorans]
MVSHLEKGRRGEDLAYRYILGLGWPVLGRNVRFRSGELDLVARDDDIMVVVEVRYRSVAVLMPTEATIGPRKMRRLVRAGATYMNQVGWDGFWRIDLVALTERRGRIQLDHYRDITGGDVVL